MEIYHNSGKDLNEKGRKSLFSILPGGYFIFLGLGKWHVENAWAWVSQSNLRDFLQN